jgi:hypothetical protein
MDSSALEALSLDAPGVETQLAQPVRFSIPNLDNDEFAGCRAKRRSEVIMTLRILERVHALRDQPNFVDATDRLADGYRHLRGYSGASLRRKYAAYIAGNCNWRVLLKDYRAPSQQSDDFKELVKGLIEENHRSVAEALAVLRDELWAAGAAIPGIGTWRDWWQKVFPSISVPAQFPGIFPTGWTVRNLRRYGPSRAEKKVFQEGLMAAHPYLPVLRRDPSKLRPMEWIVIDDFQLDVMCCFHGDPERGIKPQISYVAGLMAMDVGTRKKLAWLLGPLVKREVKQPDGTTRMVECNIRAVDVQALLYKVFQHGLPDYQVTIVCENRTATIGPALELMLSTIYDGRIRVQRTSLIDHKTLANGFVEHLGAFWEKGWIESEFNKLWNMMANQKGYKGSNERLNGPGDLDDQREYCGRFLGQGAKQLNLPPEVIAELQLPFKSPDELEIAFSAVIDRSERRTDHRCLGFEVLTTFRWPSPQLPAPQGIDPAGPNDFGALACLTQQQQQMMIPVERKESPLERWERLSAIHPRRALKAGVLALFMLSPNEATWRSQAVTFTRKDGAETKGYSYVDDDGIMADVPEGTKVLAYVDTAAPESAMIAKTDGTMLGSLRMLGKSTRGVDITDAAAMAEARARRAVIVNRVLATVRARPLHQATDAALKASREHNEAVVTAYQRGIADLPAAEKTAASMSATNARQADAKAQEKALRKARDESADLLVESAPAAAPAAGTFQPEDLL